MKKFGIKPSMITYNTLIMSCIRNKQPQRGWLVYNSMQEDFVEPDIIMYTTLLKLCSLENESEKALQIYSELLMANLQPNVVTFTELIRCLAKRKEMYSQAFDIFEQMKSKGVQPNEYVISSLLLATACQNDLDAAFELWKIVEMLKLPKYTVLYCAMLNVLAKSQKFESIRTTEYGELTQGARIRMATKILSEITESGLPLNLSLLNNALNVLTVANRCYQGLISFFV